MAMKGAIRQIAVCLMACWCAFGASLQLVWTFDLQKVQGVGVSEELPIRGLRFSPSGQQIAVVAGFLNDNDGRRVSNLFVVGTKEPAANAKVIKVITGIDELESGVATNSFQWSPDGRIILVGGLVVTLPDLGACRVPDLGGFVNNDKIVADATGNFGRLLEFGSDCRVLSTWDPGENWMVVDASADKGLLLVSREMPAPKRTFPPHNETLVVRAADRAIIGRWPASQVPSGRFADFGNAICNGSDADEADRVPVRCWSSADGKVIATAPTVNGGSPFAVATNGTRMIASDYHRYRIPFSSEYGERLKRRVVWDFKTGEELASWEPEKQNFVDNSAKTPTKVSDMAKFAISADGQYVLDGANGILRLYKIAP